MQWTGRFTAAISDFHARSNFTHGERNIKYSNINFTHFLLYGMTTRTTELKVYGVLFHILIYRLIPLSN